MSINIITKRFIVINESKINLMENIVSGNNTLMNQIDKLS